MATETTPLLLDPNAATTTTDDSLSSIGISARRQSLNAIAAGRQSEFGGANLGLEEFRSIVKKNRLLSRSEQRDDAVSQQVRSIIHDEPGLVLPQPRLDATTSIRESGILFAW